MDDHAAELIAGLPDASGTFTGTFDPGVAERLLGDVPELFPVEIDTYDEPNDLARAAAPMVLTITFGAGEAWRLPIDHAEQLDGNRVRVWVRRGGQRVADPFDPGAVRVDGGPFDAVGTTSPDWREPSRPGAADAPGEPPG